MITVTNQFLDVNLNIEFKTLNSSKNIQVNIENDINFKPVVEYLIELIPLNDCLEYHFTDEVAIGPDSKLALIQETISEIYNRYNSAIDKLKLPKLVIESNNSMVNPDDGLPF